LKAEICILAGGLSQRMGRDKSRLRLGGASMLTLIQQAARKSGHSIRVIRKDAVPRCGPLGGIFTALSTSDADRILFLACDMPFVTAELVGHLLNTQEKNPARALFAGQDVRAGFPFIIPRAALEVVKAEIATGELSLQSLATALKAVKLSLPKRWLGQLSNINTPAKFENARRRFKRR
jgi:molybdopterin-guanine dinucleotide biosynthesis protein A